jgi:hypothetical protein
MGHAVEEAKRQGEQRSRGYKIQEHS